MPYAVLFIVPNSAKSYLEHLFENVSILPEVIEHALTPIRDSVARKATNKRDLRDIHRPEMLLSTFT